MAQDDGKMARHITADTLFPHNFLDYLSGRKKVHSIARKSIL